jgi:Na+/H+ antiporter NhaD/arsenite permease-like protein
MWLSTLIVVLCFIGVVAAILTEKVNRGVASLVAAVITYFTLVFLEGQDFGLLVTLLFGSPQDGFVNLHSLILIISMMIIVAIAHEAGVFQFLAVKLIKMSNGRPIALLSVYCIITLVISSILNNILTVILLIPLTITVSRILNVDPTPYILTQAILVNIGGSVFAISSIPNILIVNSTGITFAEFFLNVGVLSIVVFGFTLVFFILLYKESLRIPPEGVEVLREFDVWNFVADKKTMVQSLTGLIVLFILFVAVPESLTTPDIVALCVALVLIFVTRSDAEKVLKKIDVELLFYLMGVFVIAGAMEVTGLVETMVGGLGVIIGDNPLIQVIIIIWLSAVLSSTIDNIPITQVLIPIIESFGSKPNFYALAIGVNWGDNLTPLGDNVLVMNIAAQNKRHINPKQFFKLGFVTTLFQLYVVTILLVLQTELVVGTILALVSLGLVGGVWGLVNFGPATTRAILKPALAKLKKAIIA